MLYCFRTVYSIFLQLKWRKLPHLFWLSCPKSDTRWRFHNQISNPFWRGLCLDAPNLLWNFSLSFHQCNPASPVAYKGSSLNSRYTKNWQGSSRTKYGLNRSLSYLLWEYIGLGWNTFSSHTFLFVPVWDSVLRFHLFWLRSWLNDFFYTFSVIELCLLSHWQMHNSPPLNSILNPICKTELTHCCVSFKVSE